jgi:predicted nuclease with TOPRIM domain
VILGGELRKQIRQLRQRSAALQERCRKLTSRYSDLQKQYSNLRRVTAEHRKAIADKFRKTTATQASVHIFPGKTAPATTKDEPPSQLQSDQRYASEAKSKAA